VTRHCEKSNSDATSHITGNSRIIKFLDNQPNRSAMESFWKFHNFFFLRNIQTETGE